MADGIRGWGSLAVLTALTKIEQIQWLMALEAGALLLSVHCLHILFLENGQKCCIKNKFGTVCMIFSFILCNQNFDQFKAQYLV